MKLSGGYLLVKQPFIRTSIHKHTSAMPEAVSQTVLDAVNTVQRTPWTINRFILDVAQEAWSSGDRLGGLPDPEDRPLPARMSDAAWETMGKEERAAYKANLAMIHGENARAQSHREEVLRKLQIANELRDHPYIWMPHTIDFRGRLYPLPQDLHPQGDDLTKGLLMFGAGKPAGKAGVPWLAVRLANTFGMDKLSFDDRIKWVVEHEEDIIDSATNPLDGRRYWNQADEPWQFLATCYEWKLYTEQGEDFVSHLPCHVDGTCNGLQHLSALGRDHVGAKATNLTRSEVREDIYVRVAEVVERIVERDAKEGRPEAIHWRGKVTRKTVKRGVMTTPYGVTTRGLRDQLITDRHTDGLEGSALENANYMRDVMGEAISRTVESARAIMGYLQDTAKALAEADIEFRWTTPAGLRVQQSYYGRLKKDVKTLYGKVALWEESEDLGLNVNKQALAAAPNFIHSFDAAHLCLTVNAAAAEGITSFSLVHDSYGTHACDTPALARILREQFVAIYREDWLAKLEEEVKSYVPAGMALPARPVGGSFDVEEVLNAPYFFA
jgi:DNA-directed RNA polymerase